MMLISVSTSLMENQNKFVGKFELNESCEQQKFQQWCNNLQEKKINWGVPRDKISELIIKQL